MERAAPCPPAVMPLALFVPKCLASQLLISQQLTPLHLWGLCFTLMLLLLCCHQVSELGVPYVLMHMRGDPNTMQSTQHTTYSQGVVRGVAQELTHTAHKAMRAGIPAWNIITDPGA